MLHISTRTGDDNQHLKVQATCFQIALPGSFVYSTCSTETLIPFYSPFLLQIYGSRSPECAALSVVRVPFIRSTAARCPLKPSQLQQLNILRLKLAVMSPATIIVLL